MEADLTVEDYQAAWRAGHWLKTDPRPNIMNRKGAIPSHPEVHSFIFGDLVLFATVHERKRKRQSGELVIKTISILACKPRISREV